MRQDAGPASVNNIDADQIEGDSAGVGKSIANLNGIKASDDAVCRLVADLAPHGAAAGYLPASEPFQSRKTSISMPSG